MNRPLLVRIVSAAALLALAVGLIYVSISHRRTISPIAMATPASGGGASPTPGSSPVPPAPPTSKAPGTDLDQLADRLSQASPEEARKILQEIRTYLTGLPKDAAVALLQKYFASNRDLTTKLQFSISPDGSLKEAPTLRVWLLDCLSLVDPQTAAGYARTILGSSNSPDEWAVSLRDFARVRNSPDDVAFVQAKIREMLGRPDWLQNPSAGFLEAFDAIVYTHDKTMTPDLARLVQDPENRAAAHAAYLTLDRLVIDDTAAVLLQLHNDPKMLEGHEQTRANYFARADVRDPQQRAVLEAYLLDPVRTPKELQTFAGLYPSGNFMISNNLLTKVATPGRDDLAAHDREALQTVEGWMTDPRFTALLPQLQQIHGRLATFVKQAAQ